MTAETPWHRLESRSVRPFRSALDALVEAGLRLYADQEFEYSERMYLESVEVERLAMACRIPDLGSVSAMVGIPKDVLDVVATIEDRTCRRAVVVFRESLSRFAGAATIVDLAEDPRTPISWSGETRVQLAIVLANARPVNDSTAFRPGSWVARKVFHVGPIRDASAFPIEAQDPEFFSGRGLPRTTTYLVEMHGTDLNHGADVLTDLISVHVAKGVHAALARDEDSPMARALIRSIYVDVVTTILAAGYRELGVRGELVPGSVLSTMSERLTRATGIGGAELRRISQESTGSHLRAVVQAEADLSRTLVAAAQRR